jgi:O-antigen/teichoic acid export membrane protein
LLKKNILANYFGQGWTAIMGLIFIPIYIRLLGIESYGLIGLFGMLNTWLSLLDIGLTPTLNREMARYKAGSHSPQSIRDLLRSVETIAIIVAIIIFLSILFSSNWLATSWLHSETLPVSVVSRSFIIMGFVTSLKFVEAIYGSSIVGLQKQVVFNIANSIIATIRGVGAVLVLKFISPTIGTFFFWQAIISIASIFILSIITYSSLEKITTKAKFSFEALNEIKNFAFGIVGGTLLSFFLTQIDKILLSKLLNLEEFGYYTLAVGISGALMIFTSPITQAWFPRLTSLKEADKKEELAKEFHIGSQMITVLMGSATVVLIFFTKTFLLFWTQNQILEEKTACIVSVLSIGNLMSGLNAMPYNIQLAYGWTSLSFYIKVISVIVSIPLVWWATLNYGPIGAASIWVLVSSLYLIIGTPLMFNKILLNQKIKWIVFDVFIPLFFATITALILSIILPEPIGRINQGLTLLISGILTLIVSFFSANELRNKVVQMILNKKY